MLKGINAVLAFLLEVAMLVAFAYWGFQSASSGILQWIIGLGLPLLVMLIWGVYFAPKSARRLPITSGALISLGLFCLAAVALYAAQQPTLGIALAICAFINRGLVLYWKQW